MRKTVLMVIGFICVISIKSQTYPASEISTDLRKNADAVIRELKQELNILSLEKGIYKESKAITIFNSDAFGFAVFAKGYDKLSKIRNISISYYDKDGKQIKKVKNLEVKDYNYTSSGSLYDDNRFKYFEPDEYDYPFTIVYSFDRPFESTAHFMPFRPQGHEGVSVEKAVYTARVPRDYKLRVKELNGVKTHKFSQAGNVDIYDWNIENQQAIKSPYMGSSAEDLAQQVLLGPSKFMMEGYEGDMSTWKGLGEWQSRLNKGRDKISDEVKKKVDNLLEGVTDSREKARLIYDYLQKNTRYVSIQLGIGGFQTFDAMSVIDNGYGDCKALSNYTYSLLKYAGVPSRQVIIRAGADEDDIQTDFPSMQFNHVILAVPMEKDTVWLECTSQTTPFNFLGSFTSDRHALMVTDDGGVIVKTPKYDEKANARERSVKAQIDSEGNIRAKVKTIYKGRRFSDYYRVTRIGTEEQKKYLLNSIDLPAFDLESFDFSEDRSSEDPFLEEELDLLVRKYATKSGKRVFLTPNLLSRSDRNPPKDEKRESSIIVKYGYENVDSVSYILPENYRLEFESENVVMSSDFGDYKLTYDFDPEKNELKFTRYLLIRKGVYPADSYTKYRDFFRKIKRSDVSKVVLIGET